MTDATPCFFRDFPAEMLRLRYPEPKQRRWRAVLTPTRNGEGGDHGLTAPVVPKRAWNVPLLQPPVQAG
jgi:hypothetical protein